MKRVIYLCLLFILSVSCFDETKYFEQRNRTPPRIVLEPLGGKAVANGEDSLTITVYFPQNPNPKMVNVVFKTSEGTFYENGKAEFSSSKGYRDDQGTDIFVKANLRTTLYTRENVLVVDMPEFKRTVTHRIRYRESFPASVRVEKSKFAVKTGFSDEIQLTAFLKASPGLPSVGTEVEFIVADSISSKTSNLFRELTRTDEQGRAGVYFTPGNFNGYTGPVSFRAVTKDVNGQNVMASGSFEIQKPQQ